MPSVEENLSDPFQRLDGALSTCQALSCRDEQAFQSQFPWKAIDTTVETLTEVNMDDYYVLVLVSGD